LDNIQITLFWRKHQRSDFGFLFELVLVGLKLYHFEMTPRINASSWIAAP
jgi:hypothetical protein